MQMSSCRAQECDRLRDAPDRLLIGNFVFILNSSRESPAFSVSGLELLSYGLSAGRAAFQNGNCAREKTIVALVSS
jgi:hypothetical protein